MPPLAVNLVLLLVGHSYTVNPTIFHPSLFEPHYGFISRLAQRGLVYEYTREGAWAYGDFIDALQRTGRAVGADAQARGIARSASLSTIIAGATAAEIPDVYDLRQSGRVNGGTAARFQLPEMNLAADYLELMVPRFGRLDRQLGPLKSTATPVSDIAFSSMAGRSTWWSISTHRHRIHRCRASCMILARPVDNDCRSRRIAAADVAQHDLI